MVLVDTSVWVQHLRTGRGGLAALLEQARVIMHPFVFGELACGNLKHRAALLADFRALPAAEVASHDEVLNLIERRKLCGSGIGWIDAHLMASALLMDCGFWTLDNKLLALARGFGLTVIAQGRFSSAL